MGRRRRPLVCLSSCGLAPQGTNPRCIELDVRAGNAGCVGVRQDWIRNSRNSDLPGVITDVTRTWRSLTRKSPDSLFARLPCRIGHHKCLILQRLLHRSIAHKHSGSLEVRFARPSAGEYPAIRERDCCIVSNRNSRPRFANWAARSPVSQDANQSLTAKRAAPPV